MRTWLRSYNYNWYIMIQNAISSQCTCVSKKMVAQAIHALAVRTHDRWAQTCHCWTKSIPEKDHGEGYHWERWKNVCRGLNSNLFGNTSLKLKWYALSTVNHALEGRPSVQGLETKSTCQLQLNILDSSVLVWRISIWNGWWLGETSSTRCLTIAVSKPSRICIHTFAPSITS